MFVQVICGETTDAAGFRRQMERWDAELKPGAPGFLGSTGGVTDGGVAIAIVRFADEASARANSERPEQAAWWEETSKYWAHEPSFRESTEIEFELAGGSDDAGFVQVMEGHVSDPARLKAMETPEMVEQLRAARPDLIGTTRVWFADGSFVETAYFTNEAAARRGEVSAEFAEGPGEEYASLIGPMSFLDLSDPILLSP
jgi:hypothetical protein